MSKADTYEMVRETRTQSAFIRVYRPILTEAERTKRLEQVRKASAELLKGLQKRKAA